MIRAIYRKIPVEVLAEYEAGDEKYAAIRAIDGKLFLRKDKWMTKTEYATVRFEELTELTPEPIMKTETSNLLEMALEYADKQQWYAGESVWLWRNGNKGAFLKEEDGMFVTLNITGYRQYLVIYWLNSETWRWEISRNLGANYYQWIDQYKEDIP